MDQEIDFNAKLEKDRRADRERERGGGGREGGGGGEEEERGRER